MQDIIGKQLGAYEIVSQIDMGGMATIYKGYQPDEERTVALKVLSPQFARNSTFVERFLQEAQILVRLKHPHILPVYELGKSDGLLYMVMQLVTGGTLHDRFHGQPFAVVEIIRLISQIGSALDYAHAEGVVHRDIKMKNILMNLDENCLLTDFGIAKVLASDANLTQLGRTIGTPAYMSPEQIQGKSLDGRSDIYALGVLLFQLSTGILPFDSEKAQELLTQHLYDPVPGAKAINPDLPRGFDTVLQKALAKDRDERYDTAQAMITALQTALDEPPEPLEEEKEAGGATMTFSTQDHQADWPPRRSREATRLSKKENGQPETQTSSTQNEDEATVMVSPEEMARRLAQAAQPEIVADGAQAVQPASSGGQAGLWFGLGGMAFMGLVGVILLLLAALYFFFF